MSSGARPLTGLRLGGRLDRYVASLFVGSYAVASLLVVGIFLIVDLAANLDEYLRPGTDGVTPAGLEVVRLYAYQLPFLFLEVAPFVTLVGGLFAVSRLMRNREVVAVLGAGVSARRLLLPVFVVAALLGLSMFGLREWATEALAARRDGLVDRLLERRDVMVLEDLWVRDAAGNPLRVDRFIPGGPGRPPRVEGLGATLRRGERWTNLVAESGTWSDDRWLLEKGWREDVDDQARTREPVRVLESGSFTPGDAYTAWRSRTAPMELSYAEVHELVSRDPDDVQWQTLLQVHLSFPFAHLVLLLVGLPFLLRHDRGRGVEGVATGFILCVFYFATDFVSRALGLEGELGPLVAGWLPVLLFGSLGVVLFGSVRT